MEELGVGYGRFKERVRSGYVDSRRVGSRNRLVIWVDTDERERLGQLRDYLHPGRSNNYPVELTRPKARSDRDCGRWPKAPRDTIDKEFGQ